MKNNFKIYINNIWYISLIFINILCPLLFSDNLQKIFSDIYQKMKYLPEVENIRFDRNQICTHNSIISDLIKNYYKDNEEKYFCLANNSLYILINSTYSEILFNLSLTTIYNFE